MLDAIDLTRTGSVGSGGHVDVEPGEQALFAKGTMGPPLADLPDEAFWNTLIVTTGSRPNRIQTAVEERGLDPRRIGVVPITANDVDYDGPLWVSKRVAPSDLTGISVEVSRGFQYLDAGTGWLVFDSISTLLMYSEERRVYKLTNWLIANARDNDVRGVYALLRDVVAPQTFNRFRSLCDVVIEAEDLN
ncbi:hypothetical protein HUG10_03800 [Halorarum halophilum]|uniref:Uncharacterized protein n=1 Tax=Halorarum halophilum TaxID=2743090 RepID=A0A7D5K6H5_9EURY|nr:hypothetical protein [Halobaculum halophilum]QLG26719.1 hypothetical protein HUG10_03800 [Halobaculum halophilum]